MQLNESLYISLSGRRPCIKPLQKDKYLFLKVTFNRTIGHFLAQVKTQTFIYPSKTKPPFCCLIDLYTLSSIQLFSHFTMGSAGFGKVKLNRRKGSMFAWKAGINVFSLKKRQQSGPLPSLIHNKPLIPA